MKTFEAFKPLLDNILSTETVFEWENGEHTADERPKSLVQGLNTLRQVLKQFIPELDLYQVSCVFDSRALWSHILMG